MKAGYVVSRLFPVLKTKELPKSTQYDIKHKSRHIRILVTVSLLWIPKGLWLV